MNRDFEVWEAVFAHSQLLLAGSTIENHEPLRDIFILFKPVQHMLMPYRFRGLMITVLEDEEEKQRLVPLGFNSKGNIFRIESANQLVSFVEAGSVHVLQGTPEINATNAWNGSSLIRAINEGKSNLTEVSSFK